MAQSIKKILIAAVATAVIGVGVTVSTAVASVPLSLVLPQATAFAYIGHSCGGIQEKVYGTGFGGTQNFPTGVVQMTTTCSTGGRGSRPATFTGWAEASGDLTGATVTSSALAAAPPLNPTLAVFDSHGNELYNQSAHAYLLLASGFVPVPRVISLSLVAGPSSGSTTLTVIGTGFTGAASVHFGPTSAPFTVSSDTSMSVTTPSSAPGVFGLVVTTPGGSNFPTSADLFTFVAAPSVAGLTPNRGPITGGTHVTISGKYLSGVTTVMLGDTAIGFTIVNDQKISIVTPLNDAVDTVAIHVVSLGGTSASVPADQFTFAAIVPSVVMRPGSGAPGALVRASGRNFQAGERVQVWYRTGLSTPHPSAFVICAGTATALGSFSCAGTVHTAVAGSPGTHVVVATGKLSKLKATTTFNLT